MLHGETLDEYGNFTLENLQGKDDDGKPAKPPFGQIIKYTLKDGEQTYKPKFAISGFRYAN